MLLFALNASFAHQALGILNLAAHINANTAGQNCEILECNINERDDEIFYKLYTKSENILNSASKKINKKIIGFSCYIWNIEKMLKFADNLKKLMPDIIIVFGGPEVSHCGIEEFLRLYPFVDFLIQGEGENALLELYVHINYGGDICSPAIISQRIIHGQTQSAPAQDWHNNHKTVYENAAEYHTVYYESSRGCPFNCSYCISGIKNPQNINDKIKVRAKSIAQVMDELKFIEEKYYDVENSKINIIKFCDRTFNFDIKRANELYKRLIERAEDYYKNDKSSFNNIYNKYNKKLLPYQFEIYPALFDDNSFEILKRTPNGLFQMEIGLQSLNPETLKAIGRNDFEINYALENISKIKNLNNIPVHADLIAGLPHEDLRSFAGGLNLLYEKTKPDFIQIGFLKLLKGTRIRAEAELHEYIFEKTPPYTVLKNKYMSFEDITLIQSIEKIYKRYSSVAYKNSFNFIYGKYFQGNIFDFLKHLAVYWRKNGLFERQISQKDAFTAFYQAFSGSIAADTADDRVLSDFLREDFYTHEGKKLYLNSI